MSLLSISGIQQNISSLSGWVDSTPMNQVIDTVTYDLYESNNPFRRTFDKTDINNKGLRIAANTSARVGAEMFSAFTNPYYITHKVTQIPTLYNSAVNAYNRYSINS